MDSLGLLVEGKRKFGALAGFSTSQIMEYLKVAAITKVAYKLKLP